MSNTFKIRALENFDGMAAENWPFHVWLPYVQINSERFICDETKEIWHRFSAVTVFYENDDHPDGDLIEDREDLPKGLVSWHGKSGIVPKEGDTFRVLDNNDNVIFEEVVSGTSRLYGQVYATAEKQAPFSWEEIDGMKTTVVRALGETFRFHRDPDPQLLAVSPQKPVNMEILSTPIRGIPFCIRIDEFVSSKDCELTEYKDGKFLYHPFPTGGHWYEVMYCTEKDPNYARSIGWGQGTAKEVSLRLSQALNPEHIKLSLNEKIQSAYTHTAEVGSSDKSPVKESTPER